MPLEIVSPEDFYKLSKSAETEEFNFYLPMQAEFIEKSIVGGNDSDPKSWKVGGVASSADEDLEGETVSVPGIKYDYFLKYGLLNWNHLKNPGAKIGRPESAYIDRRGFCINGFLFKNVPMAQEAWLLMKTYAENPEYDRKLGWSIEGKTLKADGNRILQSFIVDVALTPCPINQKTYADILKSMRECVILEVGDKKVCHCKTSYVDLGKSIAPVIDLEKEEKSVSADKKDAMSNPEAPPGYNAPSKDPVPAMTNAAAPGHAGENEGPDGTSASSKPEAKPTPTKDPNQDPILKDLAAGYATSGQTGGGALRTQDLESKLKVLINKAILTPDEALAYAKQKGGFEDTATAIKFLEFAEALRLANTK